MQQVAAQSPLIDQLRTAERALAESQALLARMLPEFVIERLKSEPEQPITDSFAEASVLFADISGFVGIARELGGAQTVALLNRLTRAFDQLAARHGVQKIKTIGDGYMAVAGIAHPQADHCERLARMALDMQDVAARVSKETGIEIKLRIGIAAGPVMAGVIGVDKISYDVWGDTVNLASRLEHLAAAGQILISHQVMEQLGREFEPTYQCEVQIRGLGRGEAWVLDGAYAGRFYLH